MVELSFPEAEECFPLPRTIMMSGDSKSSEQVLPFRLTVHHDLQDEERALRPVKGIFHFERVLACGPSLRQLAVSGRSMRQGPGTGAELR